MYPSLVAHPDLFALRLPLKNWTGRGRRAQQALGEGSCGRLPGMFKGELEPGGGADSSLFSIIVALSPQASFVIFLLLRWTGTLQQCCGMDRDNLPPPGGLGILLSSLGDM